jgi:succinate dehydrogenase / fumarate reductase, cytochrome b subunit
MAQAIRTRGPVTGSAASAKRRSKLFLLDLYGTAVGKKYAMAISGLAMVGFIVAHMIGNLKMFLGADEINHYGEFLRELLVPLAPHGVVLWILRGGLVAMLALHLHAAYSLTQINRKARSVRYQSERDYQIASFASRTMRLTGLTVLLFLIWHLLDLTWGVTNEVGGNGQFVHGDIYNNVVRSFDRIPVAAFYVLANIALGVHLYHGVWSLFQSMGWNRPRFNQWRRAISIGVATIVVVGNVSFPIAVQAGVVG